MKFLAAAAVFVVCTVQFGRTELSNDVDEEIYKGKTAVRGQFPYTVRCIQRDSAGSTTLCAGSLISSRWIMSAAHCAKGKTSITAYLGMVNSQDGNGVLTYTISSSNIYIHPNYSASTTDNDIALYRLPSDVPLASYPYIKPVELPKLAQAPPATFNGYRATASGWGLVNDTSGTAQYLQYVTQPVLDHAQCKTIYAKLTGRSGAITNAMICGQRNTTTNGGTCQGDSGGPLAINGTSGQPVQIGITSWGIGQCSTTNPDVLTNVAYFLNWIKSVTNIPVS